MPVYRKAGSTCFIAVITVLATGLMTPVYPVSDDDREALIELYFSTNGDGWEDNSGWRDEPLSSDGFGRRMTVCFWHGIVCDWWGIDLQEIDLHENNLDGYLDCFNDLPGSAYETLSILDLSGNHLRGSIPGGLKDIDELGSLVLHDNNLSGRIPAEIGSLDLEYLNLRGNMLSGPVPSELRNLEGLEGGSLDLRWNALHTDDEAFAVFLDSRQIDGDWQATQTTAPQDIRAGASTLGSIEVLWTAIGYVGDEGAYEVHAATVSGGPYTLAATAEGKTSESVEVAGLVPRTTYYLRMRTVTYAHRFNKNNVYSEFSGEISAVTAESDLPGLSVGDISVEEQNSPAVFTVSMDAVSDLDVSFSYATSDGTAASDEDYLPMQGTGIIPAGQQSIFLEVTVVNDDLPEEEETFSLVLSEPVNAVLVAPAGNARIIDDENPGQPEGSSGSDDTSPDNVCFISAAVR